MTKRIGPGRGKAQLFGVEKYKLEKRVMEMYRQNIPASEMSRIFASEGIKLTALAINRWLKMQKTGKTTKEIEEQKEAFKSIAVDYKNEITEILNEVKEIKDIAKNTDQLDIYVKLVGRLYQGLELLAKLMGDLKPTQSVDINIVVNEINRQMFNEHKNMRDSIFNNGVIDVEPEVE